MENDSTIIIDQEQLAEKRANLLAMMMPEAFAAESSISNIPEIIYLS
jgi:hypothetical protein